MAPSTDLIQQHIRKLAPQIFVSYWTIGANLMVDSEIKLNFKSIIDEYKLSGDYVLLHWQARPKGFRRWGIYCAYHDSYYGVDADRCLITLTGNQACMSLLQVDEKVIHTVPTAMVLFERCRVRVDGDYAFIEGG